MIDNFNFTREIWEDYHDHVEVRFWNKFGTWFKTAKFDLDSGTLDVIDYIKKNSLEVDKFEIVHLTEIKHEWVRVDENE